MTANTRRMRASLVDMLEFDTRWMREAACTRHPGLPWTENPIRVTPQQVDRMRAVCVSCPVLDRCEAFIDEARVTAGLWAGRRLDGRRPADYPTIRTGAA
jgi:hypothetical protein